MTVLRKGFHLELVNKNTGRVIFSAATDEIDKELFDGLWTQLGHQIFKEEPDRQAYYEIRLSPLQ